MKKILIVGKVPPPIGGVRIHVSRLWDYFSFFNGYSLLDLNRLFSVKGFFAIISYKTIHLHTSNVYLRFFFAIAGFILRKNTIITYHGNLSRYSWIKNRFDYLSVRLCKVPIVINRSSYILAKRLNSQTRLVSAFIPPQHTEQLPKAIHEAITELRLKYKVFCTNAFNVSFDKYSKEIYGISDLIRLFYSKPDYKLIISDPSGKYREFIQFKYPELADVPFWICLDHDFYEVLKLSEGFIRNTTTDGDSLSIRESIYLNIPAFATNVVDRPSGTLVYHDFDELLAFVQLGRKTNTDDLIPDTLKDLTEIYENFYTVNK